MIEIQDVLNVYGQMLGLDCAIYLYLDSPVFKWHLACGDLNQPHNQHTQEIPDVFLFKSHSIFFSV